MEGEVKNEGKKKKSIFFFQGNGLDIYIYIREYRETKRES